MSEKRYDVIFSGKLVEGARLEQVKANVAKLFKVEVPKVERLFTGKPVMIKKAVDEKTAKKYLIAMKKAGALCEGKVHGAVAAKTKPQAASVAPKAAAAQPSGTAKSEAELAAGAGGETKYVIKEPPAGLGELGSASLDEPGAVLVEHQEVPPPQVDTGSLSMDEPGATLVEHEDVPEPQVDTSELSMDEPGATLVEHEEEEELDVDLSGLSMDEPGAVIGEHEEAEEPEIDTSKLSISSE